MKPGYFEDDSIPALTEQDLEDFEMICRIKPKKNPSNGQVVGSTIDWETMQRVPSSSGARARTERIDIDEEDFEEIPF